MAPRAISVTLRETLSTCLSAGSRDEDEDEGETGTGADDEVSACGDGDPDEVKAEEDEEDEEEEVRARGWGVGAPVGVVGVAAEEEEEEEEEGTAAREGEGGGGWRAMRILSSHTNSNLIASPCWGLNDCSLRTSILCHLMVYIGSFFRYTIVLSRYERLPHCHHHYLQKCALSKNFHSL